MVSSRLRRIIEEEEPPEPVPETQTRAQRQRTPPTLKTAIATDTEDSTIIELYTQERRTPHSKLSSTLKFTILYIRPTNQKIPGLKNAHRISSYQLEGIDVETVRDRLLPTLEGLRYKKEGHLRTIDAWEYLYTYSKREDVNAELQNKVETIRRSLEATN